MPLVDPEVTQRKLEQELALWDLNAEAFRRRGWVLLSREGMALEIAFFGRLPLPVYVPVVGACVRIDFTNYDLWAPSVEFIDPITRDFVAPPVRALIETKQGPQDLLVDAHPTTGRPFFCVPGVREYHTHPQHSGDSWLLYRGSAEGRLITICDRIWRSMARNLLGVRVTMQTLPGQQLQVQMQVMNAPGDTAQMIEAQFAQSQLAQAPAGISPEGPQVQDQAPDQAEASGA